MSDLSADGKRPLDGIRVLDLADRSAALAGRILADLGADVVMVEPPEGNPIRRLAPRFGAGESAAHHYFSANKRSTVLDLGQPRGVASFRALVAEADVLIDTERPGALSDLGLSHGDLRAVNPALIQCSVTPFGLAGAWSQWTGTDLIASAAGGLAWLSGEPKGTPIRGGSDVAYAMAGLIAASGISIALHQRDIGANAAGVHLDISLQEAVAMAVMQTATPSHWLWHGRIPRRPGLSAALRCADGGYVGHLVRPDRLAGFLAWADRVGIDHGMTAEDWRWARLDAPRKNNPVAETTLALAAALGRDDFVAGAIEADIICLPVLGFDDLGDTEQFTLNQQFRDVDHPRLGPLGYVRSPVDGMAQPVVIDPAPDLGEHQHLLDQVGSPPSLAAAEPVATGIETEAATATEIDNGVDVPDPARALQGIRVVDFTWVLAGPLGTRILASFGAEVIRIESSTKPDSMRSQIGPDGQPDPDLGGLHNSVNAGKKSLAVDVSTPAGKALVEDLIATADVVVNNFRPGALERMGFGFERLSRLRPGIILVNLPGAHPTGPWADRPTMGNILMAASGFNMLTGFPDQRPRGVGIAYPDFTSPHLLVTCLLAALRQRSITGEGQQLHLTQLSGMVSLLGAEWLHYQATGELPERRANRDPNMAPHGIYPARPSDDSADEWIAIAVTDDEAWRALVGVLDDPVAADDRFGDVDARRAAHDEVDSLIAAYTAQHDKWKLAAELQAIGVAAAPVEHLRDTVERDPQLRDHYQVVHQPARADLDVPIDREACRFVGADHRLTRSPGVGEHNHHVVCELLERSDDDYLQLVLDGVLG